jgi:glycosyltransferase 2 family protein
MNRKQFLTLFIVALVLAALVYLQVREWRRFDWTKFKEGTEGISLLGIFIGIACVHLADFLRAIRWKIFLRPTRPDVPWTSLIAPQFVGFAGLAFLGRPGELVRPYLIAKKCNTTVPSQLAIWFVERAFDIGAVALFLAIDLFVVPQVRREYSELRLFGYILLLLFFAFVALLYALWKRGPQISAWICFKITRYSKTFASSLEHKLRAASSGLHAIRDIRSFAEASIISVAIWLLVVLAYRQVMHAFNPATGLPDFGFPEAILLMGASVAGGVMQLPVVGGGSQLATIAILSRSFSYNDRPEIAVAAGIMFWLVTFISVAPLGLVLARFEHLSIRELSKESETEAAAEDCPPNGVSAPSKLSS